MGDSSGYSLGEAMVENHERVSVMRRGEGTIRFSIVDVSGTLRIADPTAFAERLRDGFGPAKAKGSIVRNQCRLPVRLQSC